MRRLAVLFFAAIVPLLALALPSGAAQPAGAPAQPGGLQVAHGVETFTGGYQQSINENDPFAAPQNVKFDTATATISGGGSQVSVTGSSGSTSVTHSFAVPSGSTLEAGQTYLDGIVDGGACSGTFEVDDLSYSGTVVESVGIQYEMQCATGIRSEGIGNDYSGAIAVQLPNVAGQGYYLYDSYGVVSGFGNNQFLCYLGAVNSATLNAPIVGMATTPDGAGYWIVASDGGVFSFGDAQFHGSTGNIHLNQPIVGMAATPDGGGYWLVAADGGIFSFGDARFHGSAGNIHLNWPIVGMAAAPGGGGYWLVALDGGIFTYGDARFHGSAGNTHHSLILGMATTPDGGGYWLVALDGGVFSYGDARFHGSTGNLALVEPIAGITATSDGGGYWLVASDGGIFSFGDAGFFGSDGGGFPGFSTITVQETLSSSGYFGPTFPETFVGLVHT